MNPEPPTFEPPTSESPGPPPGWYPDPERPADRLRWWSGAQWTAGTKQRSSAFRRAPWPGRVAMIGLTLVLLPALLYGAVIFMVVSAPSAPCPPEDDSCGEDPGLLRFAAPWLGAGGIALAAIVLAWWPHRWSLRIRIETLASGIVLIVLWLALWLFPPS